MSPKRLSTLAAGRNVCIVTPAPARSTKGNRVTALRWSRVLRALGHRVVIGEPGSRKPCDVMVALHARKSHAAIHRFRQTHPDRPIILALTGTDIYGDMNTSPQVHESLAAAWRVIVLQHGAPRLLPSPIRAKCRVILQSVAPPPRLPSPRTGMFEVCVVGHLRKVKDPFRTMMAARQLSRGSRIHITHVGAALSEAMERCARHASRIDPRYTYVGALPRWKTLRIIGRSRLMALTSTMEGGANVLSEAIALGTPVLASRIDGSIGILGARYPGYFCVGDTKGLAHLLDRAEQDSRFLRSLTASCARLAPLFRPAEEKNAWRKLLGELA